MRRLVLIVVALAAMLATAMLGRWQWSRMAQRQALQAAVAQAERLPLLDGAVLAGAVAARAPEVLLHRRIVLRGSWLGERTVFLDNRTMNQKSGFYVLTPLQLAGSSGVVVLVLRGWVPRDFADRTKLPPIAMPAGEVQIQGRLASHAPAVYALGTDGPGPIRQNIELAAYAAETGLPLAPVMVQQDGPPLDGLVRDWPAPASGAETNLNYAIQWFSLCGLIGFLLLWFQVVRPLHALRRRESGP